VTEVVELEPLRGPLDTHVAPPGSKSITNRALLAAALAEGRSTVSGALVSDDTETMLAALRVLGAGVERVGTTVVVDGGPLARAGEPVHVGHAGTVARFLPPALALGEGIYVVDGSPRMRERPVGPLVAALRRLGVAVEGEAFPLRIEGARGRVARETSVRGDLSSQFLSGLLLAAPCFADGLDVAVEGALVSNPYVDLTLDVMRAFGAGVERDGLRFRVAPGGYRATDFAVEPDASAASYFFAAAAITGGRVVVEGLGAGSRQGDLQFVRVLERMGCAVELRADETEVRGPERLTAVDVDMADISDTTQTLAAVAAFADGATRVRGVGFIRNKESDRVGATVRELRRAGIEATEDEDGLTIVGGMPRAATIETYDDHRMAMSLALLGLRVPGVAIADPDCVKKTYPGYFDDLSAIGITLHRTATLTP
jgi:3-phosphoshikimate 1-carboxyvinyltransferase